MAKYKVLFLKEMDISGKEVLWANDCEVIVTKYNNDEAKWIEEITEIQPDAILCRVDIVTAAMMDASKNLKVIGKQGAGLDNIDLPAATERGIQVVYAPTGNSNSVAEHAMFHILACARRYIHVDREFRSGNFDVRYTLKNTYELEGMTVGLIGCGRIGQLLANKCVHGFGMKVIGFDPYAKKENLTAPIELKATKEEVLKEADFISLHTPSTPETKNSFGKNEFALMKKTASLINCGRGDIVVEKDMIEALQNGEIMGAGLDVFDREPIDYNNPMFKMDNVVMTPHTAATTEQAVVRCCTTACEGIVQVLNGQPVTFPGNKIG